MVGVESSVTLALMMVQGRPGASPLNLPVMQQPASRISHTTAQKRSGRIGPSPSACTHLVGEACIVLQQLCDGVRGVPPPLLHPVQVGVDLLGPGRPVVWEERGMRGGGLSPATLVMCPGRPSSRSHPSDTPA